MQVLINDKEEILSYAIIGSIDGGTFVDDKEADKFTNGFEPTQFILVGGFVKKNTNYKEPSKEPVGNQQTVIDELVKDSIAKNVELENQKQMNQMLIKRVITLELGEI